MKKEVVQKSFVDFLREPWAFRGADGIRNNKENRTMYVELTREVNRLCEDAKQLFTGAIGVLNMVGSQSKRPPGDYHIITPTILDSDNDLFGKYQESPELISHTSVVRHNHPVVAKDIPYLKLVYEDDLRTAIINSYDYEEEAFTIYKTNNKNDVGIKRFDEITVLERLHEEYKIMLNHKDHVDEGGFYDWPKSLCFVPYEMFLAMSIDDIERYYSNYVRMSYAQKLDTLLEREDTAFPSIDRRLRSQLLPVYPVDLNKLMDELEIVGNPKRIPTPEEYILRATNDLTGKGKAYIDLKENKRHSRGLPTLPIHRIVFVSQIEEGKALLSLSAEKYMEFIGCRYLLIPNEISNRMTYFNVSDGVKKRRDEDGNLQPFFVERYANSYLEFQKLFGHDVEMELDLIVPIGSISRRKRES